LVHSESLAELAKSIKRDGLIEPVVIRVSENGRYELIAGERRLRAAKLAELDTILCRVVDVTDLQARRMCAAENMQRQDLSPVEEVEAIVEMVDAEMAEEEGYSYYGKTPYLRVSRLLMKIKSAELTDNYGNSLHKLMQRVTIIMNSLPKKKAIRSFLENDLPILKLDDGVIDLGVRIKATKARLKALQKMKEKAPKAYKAIKDNIEDETADNEIVIPGPFVDRTIDPEEASAAELDRITDDEIMEANRDHYFDTMPKPELPDDKYRVLYADPPWKYADKGLDDYGHAERHYNTMSIDDLCLMGERLKPMVADNAVLFLWVTSPLLADCFEVIRSWGFFYKTSFVWDKVKHNFGHYNSVRHELLLVCTRGSCTPDNLKLFDSVQEIERTEKHSEKPEQFRSIIDTLYIDGKKLELFSRKQVDNWDVWGDQVNDTV
jgi:N6-adenosine-specific RNA methylase IME4